MTSTLDQFTPPAGVVKAPKTEKTGGMPIKNGRYHDTNTDTTYQRVSNLLKYIDSNRYNLERWFERMTALGLSVRPDLVLGVAALGPEGDKTKLNDLCQQAKDVAGAMAGANKGNALHTATERLDRGEHIENIPLPPPFDVDLRAYRDLAFSAGFVKHPDMIERTVGIPELDYMGTLDRAKWYRSVNGELSIVDVKTEKDPTYNWVHIAAQLAAYANATHIWDDGRLRPLAELDIELNTAVGYVIHVRDGAATLYAIDLKSGWQIVQRALAQRAAYYDKDALAFEIPVTVTEPPAASLVHDSFTRTTRNGWGTADVAPAMLSDAAATPVKDLDAIHGSPGPAPGAPVDMIDMLLREVEQADDTARLSELFGISQQYPGTWPAVEMHALLRGQIVSCVNRAMHNPANTARCACGWTREARP